MPWVTGKKEYLDLASSSCRYPRPQSSGVCQANKKVVDQTEAVGHARAAYMYTRTLADIAALTGNEAYLHAIDAIWNDVVEESSTLPVALSATGNGEAFGAPYQLPNMSAYAESLCSHCQRILE